MGIESIGTQGAFESFSLSSNNIKDSSKLFNTSAGIITAAVMTFNTVSKKFNKSMSDSTSDLSDRLKSFAMEPIKILGVSSIVDSIAGLANNILDVRFKLGRELGITRNSQQEFLSGLQDQTELTLRYGGNLQDNYEVFSSLASEFRNLKMPLGVDNLVAQTELIARSLNISSSEAAAMTSSMVMFGGKTGDDITKMMNDMKDSSEHQAINYKAVGRQLANASRKMYMFSMSSVKGTKNMINMAEFSEKTGINLDKMIDSTDKFRNFSDAMEASVSASRMGLNLDVRQLMASARGGDKAMASKSVLEYMKRFINPSTGNLNNIGIDVADSLAPIIGLDREELVYALKRYGNNTEGLKNFGDYLSDIKENQGYMNQIKHSLTELLNHSVFPIMVKLLPKLDKGISSISKVILEYKEPLYKITSYTFSLFSTMMSVILPVLKAMAGPLIAMMGFLSKNTAILKTLTTAAIAWFIFDKGVKLAQATAGVVGNARSGIAQAFFSPNAVGAGGGILGKLKNKIWTDRVSGMGGKFQKGSFSRWSPENAPSMPSVPNAGGMLGKFKKGSFSKWGSRGASGIPDISNNVKMPKSLTFNQQKNMFDKRIGLAAKNTELMKASTKGMLASAARMLAFSVAMIFLAKSFQMFSTGVRWQGVLYGISAMLSFTGSLVLMSKYIQAFSLSIGQTLMLFGALSGSIFIMAKAFQMFSGLSFENMGAAIGLLVAFSGAAALLGTVLAGPVAIGAAVLAALGAGVYIFGKGLAQLIPSIIILEKLSDFMKTVADVNVLKFASNMFTLSAGLAPLFLAAAGGMAVGAGTSMANTISPQNEELVSSISALSSAVNNLSVATASNKQMAPVTILTNVNLDGELITRNVSNRMLNIIPKR